MGIYLGRGNHQLLLGPSRKKRHAPPEKLPMPLLVIGDPEGRKPMTLVERIERLLGAVVGRSTTTRGKRKE